MMSNTNVSQTTCYANAVAQYFQTPDAFQGEITDPQSLHKYAYVHGDPIQGVDPTGLFAISVSVSGLGASVQGLGGLRPNNVLRGGLAIALPLALGRLADALQFTFSGLGPAFFAVADGQGGIKTQSKYAMPEINNGGPFGGTPVAPLGDGLAIAIYGERDNPKYKDYATEAAWARGSLFLNDPPRPLTTTLAADSVTDISVRSSPMNSVTWNEILRVSKDKATLTIAGPKEAVVEKWKRVQALEIVSAYHQIGFPKVTSIPARTTGGKIVLHAEGAAFTIVLKKGSKFIGPANEF